MYANTPSRSSVVRSIICSDLAVTKRVSFSDPRFLHLPLHRRRRSRNRFSTPQEGFCMPKTCGAFTASTDTLAVLSAGTTQEVGPLTSSPLSRGQSSGGALWRAVYASGDGQTSPAYSSQSIQCLYINHLISVNKLVLSYLLLRLLPQYRN
jgi:hypothetical protein